MKQNTGFLILLFLFALAALWFTETTCYQSSPREDVAAMKRAADLAASWFRIVIDEKQERGISEKSSGAIPYSGMLGDEYSEITTTLGSIEAKTAAANPEFAALFVRMLHDAGIGEGSSVGVTLSGSFPSLTISTLAALQTIGADVVMMSSLGASSYGANQPEATWIDIEGWLIDRGGLQYSSAMVTYGAEGDTGGGISDEGKAAIGAACKRNNVKLYIPSGFEESVERRIAMLKNSKCELFINIGGNQASMGYCAHSTTIPNGYHRTVQSCMEDGRGVLVRMNESGVPFFHLLNIRDLALKNSIPLLPDGGETPGLYTARRVKPLPVLIIISLLITGIVVIRKKNVES